MNKLDKRRAFARIRNLGIVQNNKKKVEQGEDPEKIKKSKSDTVHCNLCNGSYSAEYFHRHKKACNRRAVGVKSSLSALDDGDPFIGILNRFHMNDVGNTCRSDNSIREFGRHLWLKDRAKVDKSDEVRKTVMADMRNLAHFYILFKLQLPDGVCSTDSKDIVNKKHWESFREAINLYSNRDDDSVKYGSKNSLYYLLLRFADFLIGKFLSEDGKEDEQQSVETFVKVLKYHQNSLFGDAKYLINKARQEKLRLPSRIPQEDDLRKLRDFCVKRITEIVSANEKGKSAFVELRNLVCCRLTLFNARRGGEPSRLMTRHWEERFQWVPDDLTEEERSWFDKMAIMYGTGKGNHLVSTIGEVILHHFSFIVFL